MKKKDCSLEGKINFFHKKEKSDFVFLWTLKICNFSSNCIEKLSLKDALSNHFFFWLQNSTKFWEIKHTTPLKV